MFIGFLLTNQVHADIWGVEDALLIAKAGEQLTVLQDQYTTLKRSYDTANSQLDSVNQLKNFNQGKYGFGDIGNEFKDLKNRQWAPNSWDDALNNISGGNPQRYKQLSQAYEKKHSVLSDDEYVKGASEEKLKQYKQNVAVNKAASIESTHSYDEINKHIKAVYDLSKKIEHAENTKGAIDLNSRLIAEVAYLQAQNLKIQTLISQQMAQNGASNIDTESSQAKFNQLPDGYK